jgi:hypothetical protein
VALRRLTEDFAVVGITELFEETQILIASQFPMLQIQPWKRVRVGSKPWDELDIEPNILARSAELNAVDVSLYRVMRAKMEKAASGFVDDDAYLGYKAHCLVQDPKLTRHLLVGSDRYLPPMSPQTRLRFGDHVIAALAAAQESCRPRPVVSVQLELYA